MRKFIAVPTTLAAFAAPAVAVAHEGVHDHGIWTPLYHPFSSIGGWALMAVAAYVAVKIVQRIYSKDR